MGEKASLLLSSANVAFCYTAFRLGSRYGNGGAARGLSYLNIQYFPAISVDSAGCLLVLHSCLRVALPFIVFLAGDAFYLVKFDIGGRWWANCWRIPLFCFPATRACAASAGIVRELRATRFAVG